MFVSMNACLLYLPLKAPHSVDIRTGVQTFIETTCHQPSELFESDIQRLQALRDNVVNKGKLEDPLENCLEALVQYYKTLKNVTTKLDGSIGVSLVWESTTADGSIERSDHLQLDLDCTCYNIIAVLSRIAAKYIPGQLSRASYYFQAAAGAVEFFHAEKCLTSYTERDAKVVANLLLAQAQEVLWADACQSKKDLVLISKLAMGVHSLYNSCATNAKYSRCIPSSWKIQASAKATHFRAMALWNASQLCLQQGRLDERLEKLSECMNYVQINIKRIGSLDEKLVDNIQGLASRVSVELDCFKNETKNVQIGKIPEQIDQHIIVHSIVLSNLRTNVTTLGLFEGVLQEKIRGVPSKLRGEIETYVQTELRDKYMNIIHHCRVLIGDLDSKDQMSPMEFEKHCNAYLKMQHARLVTVGGTDWFENRLRSNERLYREVDVLLKKLPEDQIVKTNLEWSNFGTMLERAKCADLLLKQRIEQIKWLVTICFLGQEQINKFIGESDAPRERRKYKIVCQELKQAKKGCMDFIGSCEKRVDALNMRLKKLNINALLKTFFVNSNCPLETYEDFTTLVEKIHDRFYEDKMILKKMQSTHIRVVQRLETAKSAFAEEAVQYHRDCSERHKVFATLVRACQLFDELSLELNKGQAFYNALCIELTRLKLSSFVLPSILQCNKVHMERKITFDKENLDELLKEKLKVSQKQVLHETRTNSIWQKGMPIRFAPPAEKVL